LPPSLTKPPHSSEKPVAHRMKDEGSVSACQDRQKSREKGRSFANGYRRLDEFFLLTQEQLPCRETSRRYDLQLA